MPTQLTIDVFCTRRTELRSWQTSTASHFRLACSLNPRTLIFTPSVYRPTYFAIWALVHNS